MEATSWAWAAMARTQALCMGVSADGIAVDVHRGDQRLASEVTAEQMWVSVIRRLQQSEEAMARRGRLHWTLPGGRDPESTVAGFVHGAVPGA